MPSVQDIRAWLNDLSQGQLDLTRDNVGLAWAALDLLQGLPDEQPPPTDEGRLSQHFTLAELIASQTATAQGIDNTPSAEVRRQLGDLCNITLEPIRTLCGNNPMLVTSGYRSPTLNAAIGGAVNSAHMVGAAADFTIPGFGTVDQVCAVIAEHLEALQIDQLINETGGGARWVHVGRAIPPSRPRHEYFSIGRTKNTLIDV
jgi:hypothetical protein